MQIHLVCLGKLKESFWREAEAEYLKRLTPYAKIEIHELREESFSEKDSVENIKKKEAEKILKELEKIAAPVVVLDENGRRMTSVEFAADIKERTLADGKICFVIGGPLGMSHEILSKSQAKLSLSKMTFTHQMARVFLWEQIYRAMMINAGRKYHY